MKRTVQMVRAGIPAAKGPGAKPSRFRGFRKVRVWYEYDLVDFVGPRRYSFWCPVDGVNVLLKIWDEQGVVGGVVE